MSAFTNLELSSMDNIAKVADLDWTVSKQQLYTRDSSGKIYDEVDGKFALVRDDTGDVISVVSDRYRPVQNREIIDFFTAFADESKGVVTHAGHYSNKDVVMFADLNLRAFADGADEHKFYLLARSGHYPGAALQILLSTVRTVCTNQFNMVDDNKGFFYSWHNVDFDSAVQQQAKNTLTRAKTFIRDFSDNIKILLAKPLDDKQAADIVRQVLPAPSFRDKPPVVAGKILELFQGTPIGNKQAHEGTAYKLWNCVTQALDHSAKGRGRSAILGNGQTAKHQFFNLLMAA